MSIRQDDHVVTVPAQQQHCQGTHIISAINRKVFRSATQQIETGDFVLVDFDTSQDKLTFTKQTGKMIINEPVDDEKEEPQLAKSDAVGLPLPTASAAPQMSKSKGEQTDV